MLLKNIQEASLIRANYLLSQERTEDAIKSIKPELDSLSNLLGIDFDKGLYIILFDEADFKDSKSVLNSKNLKIQYFFQIFQKDIEKDKFTNFFAEILMRTKNSNTVKEIMDCLQKIIKLTDENQLKILLSFVLSKNPKYVNDALYYLFNKCKNLEKEKKLSSINPSLSQDILLILSKRKNKIMSPDDTIKNTINEEVKVNNVDKDKNNDLCFYNFNTLSKNDSKKKKQSDEKM